MKYCANCNKQYPEQAVKCAVCGLPLLDMEGYVPTGSAADRAKAAVGHSGSAGKTAAPQRKPEQPAYEQRDFSAPKVSGVSKAFSVLGALLGVVLLFIVLGVLVFSVFKEDLFGAKKDTDKAVPADSSVQAEDSDPVQGDTPVTFDTLVVYNADARAYQALCCVTTWVTEDESRTLSFYGDNTYLLNRSGGSGIQKGRCTVSEGVLWFETDGALTRYNYFLQEDMLTLTDMDTGSSVIYYSHEASQQVTVDIADLPVSQDDSDSYHELVEDGPWTYEEKNYALSFFSDGTYMSSPIDGNGTEYFGSAKVSEGILCFAQGSNTTEIHRCTYSLSGGSLTIYYEDRSMTLLSEKAANARKLQSQLSEELYGKLVDGSYWCSRGDSYILRLYFYDDHTFALCQLDLTSSEEFLIREGEAYVEDDILTLQFDRTGLTYQISLQENMLYMTDNQSGGGTATYETYSTFNY